MAESAHKKCKHCEQPVYGAGDFCCHGCELAYGLVQDMGLARYYDTRYLSDDQKTLIPDETLQELSMVKFVNLKGDRQCELHLLVEGIHCASCVWLIESALSKQEGIESVRLNMTTRRLHIVWNGKAEQGDEYVKLIASLGYRAVPFNPDTLETQDKAELRFLLRCLGVAGFAAGNLMMLSIGLWTSSAEIMGLATRDFLHLISAIIGVPAALYAGRPFLYSAYNALSHKRTNMDVPISLAILLTISMSLYELSRSGEHVFFDSVVMLVFFLLIGRYLDSKAKGKARSAAAELLQLMSGAVTVIKEDGTPVMLPVDEVQEGMVVRIASGEKILVDAEVIEGESELDSSIITGESLPSEVKVGDMVLTGMVNLGAALKVKVVAAGNNTVLADIIRLMEQAEEGKADYVKLADRAASLYTPVVHTLALATFLGWVMVGGAIWQDALLIATTVLIITCPCALGLAVPVVQIVASSRLMRGGILLKTGVALERLEKVSHVVFDKTGTLTLGKLHWVNQQDIPREVQHKAAQMAMQSNHPLSKAITQHYEGELAASSQTVTEHPGKGLEMGECKLGKAQWIGIKSQQDDTHIELWFKQGDAEPIRFCFADRLRDDAQQVVQRLKTQGLAVTLLSGDRQKVVDQVATELAIDHAYAEQLPADKTAYVKALQAKGEHVLFVGDGLNDAPALGTADVSLSPSSAADISQTAADMVFMDSTHLSAVLEAIEVAQKSTTLVKGNFALAVLYNMIAVPIAVLGYVTPLVAAIAMSGSSLLVMGNAMRLKKRY